MTHRTNEEPKRKLAQDRANGMGEIDWAKYIHESNLIEGYNSEEADKCLGEAWNYLSKQTKLTHGKIKTAQRLATNHQTDLKSNWRGQYRRIPVWIAGREAPSFGLVPHLMENWLLDYADWEKEFDPLYAHILFEKCHGFVDGNGRTGRLILWWHQIRKGQEPTLFKNSEKHEVYYPLFR